MATRLLCRRAAACVLNSGGPRYGGVRPRTHALLPATAASAGGVHPSGFNGVHSRGNSSRPTGGAPIDGDLSGCALDVGDPPSGLDSTAPPVADLHNGPCVKVQDRSSASRTALPFGSPTNGGPCCYNLPDQQDVTQKAFLVFTTSGTLVKFVEIDLDKGFREVLDIGMFAGHLPSEVEQELMKVVKAAYGMVDEDKTPDSVTSVKLVKAANGLDEDTQISVDKSTAAAKPPSTKDGSYEWFRGKASNLLFGTSRAAKPPSTKDGSYEWLRGKASILLFGTSRAATDSKDGFFRWLWKWILGSGVLVFVMVALLETSVTDITLLKNLAKAWAQKFFADSIAIVDQARRKTYPDIYGAEEDTVTVEFVFVVDGVRVRVAESELKKSSVDVLKNRQHAARDAVATALFFASLSDVKKLKKVQMAALDNIIAAAAGSPSQGSSS